MINKLITYRGQEVLLGADKGAYKVGRGHFICFKEEDRIRAFYILGVGRTNDIYKEITMNWVEVELATTELKALPEYYNADGTCKVIEKVIKAHESTSKGKTIIEHPVYGPIEMYAYDAFYDLPGNARSGIVLYGIALQRFVKDRFDVDVVDLATFTFRQPVTFDLEYTVETITEPEGTEPGVYEYTVTATPVDGIAPFTYSTDGTTYSAEASFTFTDLITPSKIYVKDSAGAVASRPIEAANWNNYILP